MQDVYQIGISTKKPILSAFQGKVTLFAHVEYLIAYL